MSIGALEIVRCPAELRAEALALVLCDLAPSQRREVAKVLLVVDDEAELAHEPLFIARRDDLVCGAAWGQRQSGNIAVFWPPQIAAGEDEQTAYPLAEAVVRELDDTAVDLAQSLLQAPEIETIQVMRHVGFRHVADLLYLTCEAARFPLAAPEACEIEFEEYHGTQRGRLIKLIDRTYEGTLDCTALNGARDVEDVINGYQATGVFRPENWLFLRRCWRGYRRVVVGGPSSGAALGADVHGARAGSAWPRVGQANCAVCAVVGPRGAAWSVFLWP